MYIKVKNGNIEKYPYTIEELKKDNKQTSFPNRITSSILEENFVFAVEETGKPSVDLGKNVIEGQPKLVDGVWKQTWVITDATAEEHLARVLAARAAEYPPMSDYLDGVVKGDQAQIDKYIADCTAVKVKYPKP